MSTRRICKCYRHIGNEIVERKKRICGQISQLKDDFEESKVSHQREIIDLKASLDANTKHRT